MSIKKDIVYPIFLECCQYTENKFWKNIFEDLSYSRCPYGTYITKDFLCCSYKNKEFSYKIKKKNAQQLYRDIYRLLTYKLGILSAQERNQQRIAFHNTEKRIRNSRKTWKDIRKKNIKDCLIEKYVINMKKQYSLTIAQAKYLLSMIFMAMIFKIITSKDIHYIDGNIVNIIGINFKYQKIIFKKNMNDIQSNISLETPITPKIMSEHWKNYLSSLKKLCCFK